MKKFVLCILAFVLALTICGCKVKYENADHSFNIKFPDDMIVFVPSATAKDDPRLDQNGLTYDAIAGFGEDGGVLYAISEANGIKKAITVDVQEDTHTQALWELKKSDTTTVQELQQEYIDSFNAQDGYTVKQKGEFQQGKAYCIYLNIISGDYDSYNMVYMTTFYNGKQYSITYNYGAPMTQKEIDECHGIFDTFYITETLASSDEEPKDTTVGNAVLMLVLFIIVVLAFVMVLRMLAHRKQNQEEEKDPYVPQFANTLSESTSKKGTKEKKK